MARTKVIAANWKMYKTPEEARAFMSAFLPLVAGHTRDEIVVCPPYVDLPAVAEAAKGSAIGVGAQNVAWAKEGAFTGEIAPAMLLALGCTHAIIGHSERRQYFAETDDTVNRKVELALESGLKPILCVGEVLKEREANLTEDVLRRQISRGLRGISGKKAAKGLIVAYEPVWAIGTGKTATPQMASAAHQVIRYEMEKELGKELAEQTRILYGGSVKPENVQTLMAEEEIDGALVGGASLKAESFSAIVHW
jgi:triosephosphate isomerase